MAASWAALLKSLQERQEGGKALTAAVVWKEFKRQAARSNREDVKRLADVGEGMTPEDRAHFAVVVMPLLHRLDWPPAWDAARPDLILALEALLQETTSTKPDTFAAHLSESSPPKREAGIAIFGMAWGSLEVALDMLRRPCPPGELQSVAKLCQLGTVPATLAFEISKVGKPPSSEPKFDARSRYVEAFERYARAARAMNDAVGTVLFQGLDLGGVRDS
ncbi:hypothetical protein [Polyangium sorediatum]|uniref:Uncharacterized protein n=1 Tax=Polyangium sorediatum TaxID=889274 RepID=A0ABT6P1A7_9BACT|nr:hypothetical protein [Polyangium sorediatum]MDI1434377.1 hypothetical protein [Polyangium sorediatum]